MIKSISDAIDRIRSSDTDGSGLRCNFYTIGDIGAKVYEYEDDAINNMESQQLLHKLGFAPKVLSDVITFNADNEPQFMFLTELAITIKTIQEMEKPHIRDENIAPSRYRANFTGTYRFRHFAKLFQDIRNAGYHDWDQHYGNYGYLPSGKPVVIDCEFVHD